jgi:hypothetical protein
MRHDHFSMLPMRAFQPRNGRFGMTLEGGVESLVEDVGDALSDAADFVGGVVSDAWEGVKDVGSELDDFVSDNIPGGWGSAVAAFNPLGFATSIGGALTGGALAGAGATALGGSLLGAGGAALAGQNPIKGALAGAALGYGGSLLSQGGTATGTLGADAAFVGQDAAQLAAQGLSEAQIAQVLQGAGVESFIAADAAQLAAQGFTPGVISQNLAQSATGMNIFPSGVAQSTTFTLKDAMNVARLGQNVFGQPQIPQQMKMPDLTQQQAPGATSYEELLRLINAGKARTPNVAPIVSGGLLA